MHETQQKFRTLDDLLSAERQDRGTIRFRDMVSSVRVCRYSRTLNVMYMQNLNRPATYLKATGRYRRTGELNRFLYHLDIVCTIRRYSRIRIEGVVNEFLPAALESYGYSRFSRGGGIFDYQYNL